MTSQKRKSPRMPGLLAASAIALTLLVSACTGSSGSASNHAAATFTLGIPAAPISLDIPKDFDNNTTTYAALVTQKLETISATGVLSPELATAVSQPNATTLVYTIRSGVKFSDGTSLTAADVAWSIEHDASKTSQLASDLVSFGSATATGPLQVTVKLTGPNSRMRNHLATVIFVQEAKFGNAHPKDLGAPGAAPIGTGPYVFSSDTPQAVTLTRNPYFWGTKPNVSKIVMVPTSNDNTAQLAMRSGSLQANLVSNLKTVGQYQSISDAKLYTLTPHFAINYISMDTTSAPLNDLHVRQAIAYSLDKAGIAAATYGKYADLVNGLSTPDQIGDVAPSKSEEDAFFNGLPQYSFDPAKARQALAESAYPHGFHLTVTYDSTATWEQLTVLNLQQNMAKIGVTITPNAVPQSKWIAGIYAHKSPLGIQFLPWTSAGPDPTDFLTDATLAANENPGSFNVANWSPPAVDAAGKVLVSSSDQAARWQATQTILTAAANDLPYVPLMSPDEILVLTGGFSFSETPSILDLITNGTWVQDLKVG